MSTTIQTVTEPVIKSVNLRQIKPYARNPRENREAVEKVKQSIQEYGYNQLIAVDKSNVIIAGHTRYLALRELGWKKVQVMVLDLDDKQARAYRIIDNKTSEFAHWTDDLFKELRALDDLALMQPFFAENLKDVVAEGAGAGLHAITEDDVAKSQAELNGRFGHGSMYSSSEKELACPKCGHTFITRP
jgi:ParB-like chromosome segregation protein Spo0J